MSDNTTATDTLLMQRDAIAQAPLRAYMEKFAQRWAPTEPYDNAEFQADFLCVIQAVHRDAMEPIQQIITASLSAMPPMLFPKAEK